MDLIDALAANQGCRSVVALSQAREFRRGHGSVGRAIDEALRPKRDQEAEEPTERERRLRQPIAPLLPRPPSGAPWVLSVDATPLSRPYAKTLTDRSWVHEAQPVAGRKPLTVGHEYSLVMLLSERRVGEAVWALPIAARRVATTTTAQAVAAEQIRAIVLDRGLPTFGQRVVTVADSHYSQAGFLDSLADLPGHVSITRLRKDRVLYQQPPPRAAGKRGRRRKYGEAIRPGTVDSLVLADTACCLVEQIGSHKGRVTLYRWNNVILKGEREGKVTSTVADVVCARVLDAQGKPIYREDMLLAIVGDDRAEIDAEHALAYYRRRFDQEHSHRFMRRHLLLGAFQSADTAREENWVDFTTLAFHTLFAARDMGQLVRRPWESKLKPKTDDSPTPLLSPSQVQRDVARIFCQLGTPARSPKPRGIPSGWVAGTPRARRATHPLVKRGPPKHVIQTEAA
jgi:hypothetical protein